MSPRRKIAMIVHSAFMAQCFLIPHLRLLGSKYDLTLIVPPDAPAALAEYDLPVQYQVIPIRRKISLGADLRSLIAIWRLCRLHRYEMVHTITPKAGLLGILGAFLARVPRRVHTFQGEVWCNTTGLKRQLFKSLDWLVARLCTAVTVVSASERAFLRDQGVLRPDQGNVLGAGSIGGVDLVRFHPDPAQRSARRAALGFQDTDVVFMYLGRLNRDKGVMVLIDAFAHLAPQAAQMKLLIVGPDEDNLGAQIRASLPNDIQDRLVMAPFTSTPEHEMIATDVLVLPSFREGFGVVILEAAALGLPSLGSQIYGISDAIAAPQTGLMFPAGDMMGLASAMAELTADPDKRRAMGAAARQRVEQKFSQEQILDALLAFYQDQLVSKAPT